METSPHAKWATLLKKSFSSLYLPYMSGEVTSIYPISGQK